MHGREARVASPGRTPAAEIKVFVDTAPVMEKPLAAAAGLGWQGKHTNLLGRDIGNWVFLGAIFTTVDLPPTRPRPTIAAVAAPVSTSARPMRSRPLPARCAALHFLPDDRAQGPVDPELRPLMGNRIYGCDDCLAVCPWNKFAVAASETRYAARDDLKAPELAELAMLDDAGFRTRFPAARSSVSGVSGSSATCFMPSATPGRNGWLGRGLVDDPDAAVSDAARWALERLR
jgi:epoxyqueuosine reductase